jgi:hypothetical protein
MPLTSARLSRAGISPDLAVHYARAGWLERLARGVYKRAGDRLDLNEVLRALEEYVPGLHVGGKSALDRHGIRHYVAARPVLTLFGWESWRVPAWLNERFPCRYHRKRLFRETPDAMLGVSRFGQDGHGPLVSEPERAFLELLSEVGVQQSLAEAKELAQSTYTFRKKPLIRLLRACASVKTVRLCMTLGRELALPWAKELAAAGLPTGSAGRWVRPTDEGLLVLKP